MTPLSDIIFIMDGLAVGFSFQGASVVVMKKNEGFRHLASVLREGTVLVRGYKVVCMLLGRADVWNT